MPEPNSMQGKTDRPMQSCNGCLHFYITYEAGLPYACRAMGFKSRNHPCVEVLAASGTPCQMRQAGVARAENGYASRCRWPT